MATLILVLNGDMQEYSEDEITLSEMRGVRNQFLQGFDRILLETSESQIVINANHVSVVTLIEEEK